MPLADSDYKMGMKEAWVCLVILFTRKDKITMDMLLQRCISSKFKADNRFKLRI